MNADLFWQIALTLVLSAAVELPIAIWNRRGILQEVRDGEARMNARLDTLKPPVPGEFRNGVDPTDAAARRWEREAERKQRRAGTEVAIMAELVPRYGDLAVRGLWNFLRPEVRDSILDAGENWATLLGPMLGRLKPVSTTPKNDHAEYQTE